MLDFFVPWEPSVAQSVVFAACGVVYWRGAARSHPAIARQVSFWIGVALFYVSLRTRVDYYAEHQFFVHRLQHLVLHHLAPLCCLAAYPGSTLRAGMPLCWRSRLHRVRRSRAGRLLLAVIFNPALVSVGFVLSVLIWLIPSVQAVSMLDVHIYAFMNWSVAVTGLAYWWLVLDHRPSPPSRTRPGFRVLSPLVTMVPQMLAGAILTFASTDFYPYFDVCGRAFVNIPATLDQSLGGLIIWIPAAILESVGALLALRHMIRLSASKENRALRLVHAGPQRTLAVAPVATTS